MANSDEPARLTVLHVGKVYDSPAGPVPVLRDVSVSVALGETVAIQGPSGSGKSTLLNIIGSLDTPSQGTVRLGSEEPAVLSGNGLALYRSRSVGFVFQDHHLLPQCTALENVILPTLAAGRPSGSADRARELLQRVGLAERMDFVPARLSGGERQRVAVARALINRPALLLCDEPTGNLDRESGRRVASLLVELAREQPAILIVVTHDTDLAQLFARRLLLKDGTLREQHSADG